MESVKAITISITNFDNEAMATTPDQAVHDIFIKLANRIDEGGLMNLPAYIRDTNGNTVGNIIVR